MWCGETPKEGTGSGFAEDERWEVHSGKSIAERLKLESKDEYRYHELKHAKEWNVEVQNGKWNVGSGK